MSPKFKSECFIIRHSLILTRKEGKKRRQFQTNLEFLLETLRTSTGVYYNLPDVITRLNFYLGSHFSSNLISLLSITEAMLTFTKV